MSHHTVEVLLDTSALLEFALDADSRAEFVDIVRHKRLRAIIPSPALDESFVTDDKDKLRRTCVGLAHLLGELGQQASLATPHIAIWSEEYARSLPRLPVLPPICIARLRETLQAALRHDDIAGTFEQVRDAVRPWKAMRRAGDLGAQQSLNARFLELEFSVAGIRPALKGLNAHSIPDWLLDPMLVNHAGSFSGAGARVLSERKRCPAIKAWAALAYLNMLAQLIPEGIAPDDPLFSMLKPDKNDFFDAALASPAAYCNFFLTKDRSLWRRCNFLRNRGMISFTAVHLSQMSRLSA